MDTNDWRAELLPHTRQVKVNEIMSKLMIHQSLGDDDELLEVQKIAQNIEHKIYAGTASQEDYLQEVSSMMWFIRYYWRTHLQPESRQRSVDEIMETLKRHFPISGQEGLAELRQMAVRFEERIYGSATNQSDYHQRISLKLLAMKNRNQNTRALALMPSNFGVNRNGPSHAGSVRHAQVLEGQVAQSEGERNTAGRQSGRKRKQPQWLAEFVTY